MATPQAPDPLESLRESILEEADQRIERAVEDVAKDVRKLLVNEIEDAEDQIVERVKAEVVDEALMDVADSMDEEASSRPGSAKIAQMGIWITFAWSKIAVPGLRFLYIFVTFLVTTVVYVATGFFRGALWLIALRWFLLLGFIGWFGTTSLVANYDVIADALRPIFQVLDDVGLRLIAPFINDWLELGADKLCNFWNFTVEFGWCIQRLIADSFQAIITSQTAVDNDWFDDNIWGIAWADFTDVNDRMMGKMMPADPDAYLRTISLLHHRQLEYDNAVEKNATFVRSSMHRSFGPPMMFPYDDGEEETEEMDVRMFGRKRIGGLTATRGGKTYRVPIPMIPRDFALYDALEHEEAPAGDTRAKRTPEPKYAAQFLTESLLGFQFGWDPEGDFPRVNISETSVAAVDGMVEFYILVITTINDVTDAIFAGIECLLTTIKQYTIEFFLQFFLNLICGDDEDCDLTKSVQRGDVHIRVELDDILDAIRDCDWSAIADLFEYFFKDDGVLAGWFTDAYEFVYTEIIRRIFETIINVLFQIPCLNFDSIGCFLASLLDCILIIDLEICLQCHGACDPGCADDDDGSPCCLDDDSCSENCLPFSQTCCPDDDIDVMECVETECRSELDGLIAIFECFGRILLNVVGMIICPLMDVLLTFLSFITSMFNVVLEVFKEINEFIEDDLEGVFEDLENFCDIIIQPDFCVDLGPFGEECINLDFDIPGDDEQNTLCSALDPNFDIGDLIIDPIDDALVYLVALLDDFEGEVNEFCDEFGNLGENICLGIGLPSSFCETLKDAPEPNESILLQALRKRQQLREERRRGLSRAKSVANSYDELEWMAQYSDDNEEEEWKEGEKLSTDEDQEKWERRQREYVESTEHPIARWYYRLTSEKYRMNKPTKQDFKDEILAQIRRDKISHLMYVAQNPFSWYTSAGGGDENPKMKAHRRLARKLFDKTFVIDPKSTRESVGLSENKYKWDDTADYAEAMRHMQGNFSGLIAQAFAIIGKTEWVEEEANFKYPERHEIQVHMEHMGTKDYLAGFGASLYRYIRTYNEPNLLNLDRMVRIEAQRHASSPDGEHEEAEGNMPSPYKGAPSLRHRHLYATPEEKKAFRDLAERYRWYRDTPSVHIGAHIKTIALVSFTSLMAPQMIDPVVNSLASRGPAFDAPLTKYLRHFGLTRHVHNITDDLRQWRVRKLHQDELEAGELEQIVSSTHPKALATKDIPYPYDRVYNAEDYHADYQQGKDLLAGKKVDLDRVVMSRNADGTPKRIRSNALAREMTPAKIDRIHETFPFSMELSHPKLMPMTRTDMLTRNIIIQERFASRDPRAVVTISSIGTGISMAWPVVKIILQNPQVALAVVYPAVISPLGQVSIGLWGRWGIRRFNELFTDYLDFTPSGIEDVALDFAETLVYNLIYTINFAMYLLFGFLFNLGISAFLWLIALVFVIVLMAACIPFSFFIFVTAISLSFIPAAVFNTFIGSLMLVGSIPAPPAIDENGIPTQSPVLGYFHDLIYCDSTEATCTSSFDCLGGSFCDCPEHELVDYRNFLFVVGDPTPCSVPNSGTCLCWPQLKCNARVPVNTLADIFTPDCDGKFGYDFRGQVYYASNGGFFDKVWTVIQASIVNLWVQVRFIVRSLLVGWLGFVERAVGAFIGVAVSLLILVVVKKPVYFFAWTTIAVGLWYFPSAPGDFYVQFILPFFEDIAAASLTVTTVGWIDSVINKFIGWLYVDSLFDMVIDYFRFPNHSLANPLGTPDLGGGEVTCFVISIFTGFPGIIFLIITAVALLMTFATGLLWLILGLIVQFFWLLAQWVWAFVWLAREMMAKRGLFKNMRKYVSNKATNPRLRGMAQRLRARIEYSGTPEAMAATSRASMNYWLPLPTPSRSEIHEDLQKERENAKNMRKEMDAMKRQLVELQRGKDSTRGRRIPPRRPDPRPSSMKKQEGPSPIIPTVVPLYPSATHPAGLERRWEDREKAKEERTRDVETGAEVGRISSRSLASTMTRGARGFQSLWQTIRPDADTADKKLE